MKAQLSLGHLHSLIQGFTAHIDSINTIESIIYSKDPIQIVQPQFHNHLTKVYLSLKHRGRFRIGGKGVGVE